MGYRNQYIIESNIKIRKIFPAVLYFILSFIVALTVLFDDSKSVSYTYLWILPIVSGLIGACVLLRINQDIIAWIMLGLYTVRNIFAVLALRIGGYSSFIKPSESDAVNSAILFMLFEMAVMLGFTVWYCKRKNGEKPAPKKRIHKIAINPKIYLIAFLAFLFLILIVDYTFFTEYQSFFSSDNVRDVHENENGGALHTLFAVWFPIIYTFVAIFLMELVNRKVMPPLWRAVLNILFIAIPLLFMAGSDGFTLLCVVALAILSLKTGGISKRSFIIICCGGVVLIAVYILIAAADMSFRADQKTGLQKLSDLLQGYFPGVCNYSGFFSMEKHDRFRCLFYDIYATIPYRNTLFGLESDFRLAYYFNLDNYTSSQIVPCGAQLFYYFNIFGVVIECLYVRLAYRAREKMKTAANPYLYFTYCVIFLYLLLTPVAYNFTNFTARFLITLLPALIIYYFLPEIPLGKADKEQKKKGDEQQ